ncbi:hypothetical protein [Agrococcus sp. DT81.2]|uniref:hypothetical protein n=1 Tax=Agrococcus sp. DT81.2 TaxID=3393414 RepID=UPI003CE4F1C9
MILVDVRCARCRRVLVSVDEAALSDHVDGVAVHRCTDCYPPLGRRWLSEHGDGKLVTARIAIVDLQPFIERARARGKTQTAAIHFTDDPPTGILTFR